MKDKQTTKMLFNPKSMFLIDGLGALMSAFLLGVILTKYESIFGMPHEVLHFLAFMPCVFAMYDFICYFRITSNWRSYLKAIAIANLIYCCISIGLVCYHYPILTGLGWVYFMVELAIVVVLVNIEFRMVSNSNL